MDKEFPIPLHNGMTKVAIITILLGALLAALAGWKTVGWVLAAYGLLTLYLAYHFGRAPYLDDLETAEIPIEREAFER